MTPKQIITAALSHQQTDIIPYKIGFTAQAWENLVAYGAKGRIDAMTDFTAECYYEGDPKPLPERPGYFLDDFGCVWNRNGADKDIGVIDEPSIPEPDLSFWREPVFPEERLRARFATCLENAGDRFTICDFGFTLFERFWAYTGFENSLFYMAAEPEFTHALLDRICEHNLKIIDLMLEYPYDGIFFGDDWGQQKGLIMGAPMWREFIKPRQAKMYKRVKDTGRFVFQHSCGDIEEIMPDLIEMGLDCYQTFQPEIYDIAAVKAKYGGRLSFWGAISTQRLLPFETPGFIRAETKRIMGILGKGGGYIAGPTHALPGDIPPENVLAMLDTFEDQ
jgi:uroporphyrinogen decarboxylase